MTSYRRFETCPQCEGPVAARQAHPFPIVLQALFGVSFIAFILLIDRFRQQTWILWTWSAAQAAVGVLLLRARKKAAKKVLVCIKCGVPLPS